MLAKLFDVLIFFAPSAILFGCFAWLLFWPDPWPAFGGLLLVVGLAWGYFAVALLGEVWE